jgi:hypothetical protein
LAEGWIGCLDSEVTEHHRLNRKARSIRLLVNNQTFSALE